MQDPPSTLLDSGRNWMMSRVDTHQIAISAGFGSLGMLWICERSSLPIFNLDVATRFKYWDLTLTASQI